MQGINIRRYLINMHGMNIKTLINQYARYEHKNIN